MKRKKHKYKNIEEKQVQQEIIEEKEPEEITKQKKVTRVAAIVLMNVFVFILLEVGLRIFGVGLDPSLVYSTQVGEDTYLFFNKLYAYKFCPAVMPTIPAPHLELFKEKKDPNVYRIFIIGESTSRGFPYTKLQAFPGQLQRLLKNAVRDKKFEVINISMAATNSHIGADVVEQAAKYKPDLAIIYYGHNEFIGIGGSGKNKSILYRLNHVLYHTRIYQAIKLLIFNNSEKGSESLLEHMSGNLKVASNSPLYQDTITNFEESYEDMIEELQENNVKVITCGVAKNLKDFSPINSVDPTQNEIDRVNAAVQTGSPEEFSKTLDSLTKNNRNIAFKIGKMLLAQQKKDLAFLSFRKSCDMDEGRLRAPSSINAVIKKLSEKHKCTYIDFQSHLNQFDSDGVTGNELFVEHVHTTLRGHTLISRKLGEVILKDVFKRNDVDNIRNMPIPSSIVEKIATSKILKNLYTRYPLREYHYFNSIGFQDIYTVTDNSPEGLTFKNDEIAQEYAYLEQYFNKFDKIDQVHFAVGVDYFMQKKYDEAYREFSLAYGLNPMYLSALNNMAVMRYFAGDKKTSFEMMDRVYKLNPEFKTGVTNLWFYHKLNNNNKEVKKLEDELEDLDVEYRDITRFTLELAK